MNTTHILKVLTHGLIISSISVLLACQSIERVWDVRDFGALADSVTVNTVAIQNAIDACSEAGGGKVTIEEGSYITGTLILKDNVNLYVAENSKLLGSGDPRDYLNIDPFVDATGQSRGKCLIGAVEAVNISITGKGIIDGRGELYKKGYARKILLKSGVEGEDLQKYLGNRPFLVRFVRSSTIRVQDIHLRQPAAWTLHYYQCEHIVVDGIDIYAHAHSNNDGIDMDSSSDGLIQNCTIDSGDDAICFKTTSPTPTKNITVNNCRLKSHWGTIKFGTESMGDFQNINIKNCYIHDTRGGGIKILSVDGARISNIRIDSIEMENVDMPVFIRLGERLRTYRDAPQQEVGSIIDVSISNVWAKTRGLEESRVTPPAGVFITGTPNHKIGRVILENVNIHLPGGGTREHASIIVPEDETRYPEFSFFGVLPASGFFVRHVEDLTVKEITVKMDSEDRRKTHVYVDVEKVNNNSLN